MRDMIGPITFEMKVHFTNDSGETASTTCDLERGVYPDAENIHRLIGESMAVVGQRGFKLMDTEDFVNHVIVKELTGRSGKFAVATSDMYDTAALGAAATEAYERYRDEKAQNAELAQAESDDDEYEEDWDEEE